METLTFQELQIKYWPVVEKFCFNILKKRSEAVIIGANVFTTLQTRIAKEGVDKWQDEEKIVLTLYYIARQRCIERLQWLRRKDELRNPVVRFLERFIKTIKLCLKTTE
jgi:hypothetical protein